ncbi:hypothetical protein ACFXPQ_10570 [Streptomyces lydicus]|uniref:hypothetical protein n=1 Tax=Streptomyces lydicus TaxID=47763 RepID=UPI0036A6E7A3
MKYKLGAGIAAGMALGLLGAGTAAAAPGVGYPGGPVAVVVPAGPASAASTSTESSTPEVVPGQEQAARTVTVSVRGAGVAVRAYEAANNCRNYPSGRCRLLGRVTNVKAQATCRKKGQKVTAAGATSVWWTFLDPKGAVPGGWVSNVYVHGDGVPKCA